MQAYRIWTVQRLSLRCVTGAIPPRCARWHIAGGQRRRVRGASWRSPFFSALARTGEFRRHDAGAAAPGRPRPLRHGLIDLAIDLALFAAITELRDERPRQRTPSGTPSARSAAGGEGGHQDGVLNRRIRGVAARAYAADRFGRTAVDAASPAQRPQLRLVGRGTESPPRRSSASNCSRNRRSAGPVGLEIGAQPREVTQLHDRRGVRHHPQKRAQSRSASAITRASPRSSLALAAANQPENALAASIDRPDEAASTHVSTSWSARNSIPSNRGAGTPQVSPPTLARRDARGRCATCRVPRTPPSPSITQNACWSLAQSMPSHRPGCPSHSLHATREPPPPRTALEAPLPRRSSHGGPVEAQVSSSCSKHCPDGSSTGADLSRRGRAALPNSPNRSPRLGKRCTLSTTQAYATQDRRKPKNRHHRPDLSVGD